MRLPLSGEMRVLLIAASYLCVGVLMLALQQVSSAEQEPTTTGSTPSPMLIVQFDPLAYSKGPPYRPTRTHCAIHDCRVAVLTGSWRDLRSMQERQPVRADHRRRRSLG